MKKNVDLKLVESGFCVFQNALESGDIIHPLDIFISFLFLKMLCNLDPAFSVNRRDKKIDCI